MDSWSSPIPSFRCAHGNVTRIILTYIPRHSSSFLLLRSSLFSAMAPLCCFIYNVYVYWRKVWVLLSVTARNIPFSAICLEHSTTTREYRRMYTPCPHKPWPANRYSLPYSSKVYPNASIVCRSVVTPYNCIQYTLCICCFADGYRNITYSSCIRQRRRSIDLFNFSLFLFYTLCFFSSHLLTLSLRISFHVSLRLRN